ncbi:hypothetical protein OHS18_12905 [Amycolatopsis sp. NBC_00355]|uniref:hypothetical protein n=1 Tax=Amycolatopsis sp. NBC_00355 TaxID=2975957 RepID=UPI002E27671C
MRMLRTVALVVWPISWYLVWKEIFHWRHMTKTLRFRAPDPPPGMTVTPKPGVPVRCLRAVAVVSPVVCVLGFTADAWRRGHAGRTRPTS